MVRLLSVIILLASVVIVMKESDNYETDYWLYNLFIHYHDPCPFRGVYENGWTNSLLEEWQSYNFVNPPYSDVLPWVEKSICEYQKGNTVVLLLKCDTSTRWYRKLYEAGAKFMFFHGRLKFRTGRAFGWPSMLAILSHDKEVNNNEKATDD